MPTQPSTTARDRVRSVAPKLIDYTENVLFGDVWERPGLSKRDRSLITVAALVALYRGRRAPRKACVPANCCSRALSMGPHRRGLAV
jgi:alkylhydroperoxidase/carboxymuconolactone decarboxylase family protein YurZ